MGKPLTALTAYQQSPADWIIPNLLKRRNTGFIIGRPKQAAKSWLMLNLGWDLADGSNVWQVVHSKDGEVMKPLRPMRVFYFTQEDTEDDLYDRFKLLVNAGRVPTNNFWYETTDLDLMLDNDKGERKILHRLDEAAQDAPLDLIMFDPMRRCHMFDENDSLEMARFWRSVRHIQARYNCACLFSHHIVKLGPNSPSESDPMAARGSGDIFGSADAFISVAPRKKSGNPNRGSLIQPLTLHFQIKRSKPRPPIDLSVSFTTGLVQFDGFTP